MDLEKLGERILKDFDVFSVDDLIKKYNVKKASIYGALRKLKRKGKIILLWKIGHETVYAKR